MSNHCSVESTMIMLAMVGGGFVAIPVNTISCVKDKVDDKGRWQYTEVCCVGSHLAYKVDVTCKEVYKAIMTGVTK